MDDELSRPTNGFQWLPCVFGVDVVDLSLQLQDLLSLDGDVCGLTLNTQQANDHLYMLHNFPNFHVFVMMLHFRSG